MRRGRERLRRVGDTEKERGKKKMGNDYFQRREEKMYYERTFVIRDLRGQEHLHWEGFLLA